MLTVDDVHHAYVSYHKLHFDAHPHELPKLDMLVVYDTQHTEVILGRRSTAYAQLILKLLQKLAWEKSTTLMLVVPFGEADLLECGFVRYKDRWVAVC